MARVVSDTISLKRRERRFLDSVIPHDVGELTCELAGIGASRRQFIRVRHNATASSWILVRWTSRDPEWTRFLDLSKDLTDRTTILPTVDSASSSLGLILMEDLGTQTLASCYAKHRHDSAQINALIGDVIDAMLTWHSIPTHISPTLASGGVDHDSLMRETAFFARNFVKRYCQLGDISGDQWHQDRWRLAQEVADLPRTCIHRDLHSQNVMVAKSGIRFVDFGSACRGPAEYDLADLLFDPALNLPPEAVATAYRRYRANSSNGGFRDDERSFQVSALQKLMGVIGAHARFVLDRDDSSYAPLISHSVNRLLYLLNDLGGFPAISDVMAQCAAVDYVVQGRSPKAVEGSWRPFKWRPFADN